MENRSPQITGDKFAQELITENGPPEAGKPRQRRASLEPKSVMTIGGFWNRGIGELGDWGIEEFRNWRIIELGD
jgi:hypothetical protein